MKRQSPCLLAFFYLLLTGTCQAFLGDDKATIDREYGHPVPSEGAPDAQMFVYHASGYRISVSFEFGRSTAETFRPISADGAFPAGAVDAFLRAHADGKVWQSTAAENDGEQRWWRDGAKARYLSKDDPQFTIVSDFFDTGKPIPARNAPAAAPVVQPRLIATINGTGDKTSDPFTITAEGGFTLEYETGGQVFSLRVYQQSDKQSVHHAGLHSAGKDHTFVPVGAGAYYLSIIASGPYTVTVHQ